MDILAFFAHPDDETMLAGGTLAFLAQLGVRIHYLCATRGEGGEAGDPPLCSREELGRMRSAEVTCAVKALGGTSLDFLEYIDPTVGPDNQLYPFMDDTARLARQVLQKAEALHAVGIISHGSAGEYGHPAHKLAHQAARLAVEMAGTDKLLFYTIQGCFEGHPKPRLMNLNDPAHLILDVQPVLQAKIAATLCHRTQHALFIRHTSELVGHPVSVPEVVISLESLHRVFPLYQGALDDILARLLLSQKSFVERS